MIQSQPSSAPRSSHSAPCRWLAGALLILALASVLWVWREDRRLIGRLLGEVRDALSILGHRLDTQELERASTQRVLGSLSEGLDAMRGALAERNAGQSPPDDPAAEGPASIALAPSAAEEDSQSLELADLPPLPEGVHPTTAIREIADVADLLKDERWNPSGRELDEAEIAELRVEFARARGECERLEAEMYRDLTAARAALRERGEAIEYAPGERYASMPGALTAAEPLPGGGARMFYVQRAEFPEVHQKRADRNARAERFFREFRRKLEEP